MRRRTWMVSAAALGVAGAAALTTRRHPHWLRRLGLVHSPDHVPADFHVPLVSGTFASRHLRRETRWRLSLPRGGALATVFCLHGRNSNCDAAFDEQRLPDMAAESGLPLAIASVDGGATCYWHSRSDGTDAMAMLVEELLPLVERRTGTTRRLLLGWSMGGLGVLLTAERHPRLFDGVAAISPAVWTRLQEATPGAFDGEDDFRRHDVFADRAQLAGTPVFIACGTGEPYLTHAREFAAGLSGATAVFGPGFHDAGYWRSVAPAALQFLARAVRSAPG